MESVSGRLTIGEAGHSRANADGAECVILAGTKIGSESI